MKKHVSTKKLLSFLSYMEYCRRKYIVSMASEPVVRLHDSRSMVKIVVGTEQDKAELLEGSRHIHYLRDLDTGIPGANLLAHLYMNPSLIEVQGSV